MICQFFLFIHSFITYIEREKRRESWLNRELKKGNIEKGKSSNLSKIDIKKIDEK